MSSNGMEARSRPCSLSETRPESHARRAEIASRASASDHGDGVPPGRSDVHPLWFSFGKYIHQPSFGISRCAALIVCVCVCVCV